MTKDWYSPNRLRFTRSQILWLIKHLPTLRQHQYPPDPRETGYIDPGTIVKRGKPRAPFETAALLLAELEEKIEACGMDGLLLEMVYCLAPTDQTADVTALMSHIGKALGLSVDAIDNSCLRAIRYLEKSYWESYPEFKSKKKGAKRK